jgi:glycosyltransferase involved in cell wall biosynthesis
MYGKGVQYLERSLDILERQTYDNYEIVVSDNSDDHAIEKLCKEFDVRYIRNPIKGMAANTNNAIKEAKGDLIKILYQDDFLAYDEALEDIVNNFEGSWLATGCSNHPHPFYSEVNTIGSPSVITIKNGLDLWFDEHLTWALDLDFYKRLYAKYGEPKILDIVGVAMGLGDHQVTNNLSDEIKMYEENLVAAKR